MSELVINEANFHLYFFDVRKHQPQRGQVIARYAAMAEFVDGSLKRDIIDILSHTESGETAVKMMKKVGCATERDSMAVPLEIARDLAFKGMTVEEVAQKPYSFVCEAFFYTKKENIPVDDPHWSCISLQNLDEFIDAKEQKLKLTGRILRDEEKPKDLSTYAHYESAGSDPSAEGVSNTEAEAGSTSSSS